MRSFSICTFSSPLYASIWLKMWPCWVTWLLCLCPMFPLIRLGHKGSTSAIVTAGSAGCVPQTGWSQKLASLREYSVGEQKMSFVYYKREPQEFSILHFCSQSGHVHRCMLAQGKEPLTELFSGLYAPHMCYSSTCTFFRHYMHRYNLSFVQAGLPGSCVYALRSH